MPDMMKGNTPAYEVTQKHIKKGALRSVFYESDS